VLVHRHHILSLPVVDETNRLIGVIRSDRLVHMRDERVGLDLLGVLGVTRLRPAESVASTVRHRLPWLMVNLITVLLAASVVGLFQGTIESVVALAIFLPVLAGHGANTGMQTVAVMVRTLATVELGHRGWLRIMRHELAAASVHGIVIGVLVGIGGGLWSGSATFGLVVASGALAATLMAGLTGTLIPMALHAVRQDPSSGSGVVVTTFTDMTGFFVMLGLGTLLIGRLV